MRRAASHIGVYLLAALVGFLTVEVAYRVHLLMKDNRIQLRPETVAELPLLGVYSRSLWRFDVAEGFQYVRDQIFATHIANGRIAACQALPRINKYGSPGIVEG